MALPISYSWRSLIARGTRTAFTVAVIALVVIATTLFWSLIASLKRTLVSSGSPENLVVMRKGATNDGSSQLTLESLQAIRFFEGIARDSDGNPLISPELVVQPFFATTDGGRENVLVRGVEPMALRVHDEVVIAEGRMFNPSSGEAVVGRGVSRRYAGASLGNELKFGRGTWKVVGILDSGGSSFESEVWVDVRELANDAKRTLPYSGVRLRVAPGADMDALARRIGDDPRYALEATREVDYYESLSSSANTLYVIVVGLAVLAGVGAVFGATNTMYAAVQSRTAEIGTLRALGFSRGSILLAFLSESVMMALFAFALGAIGASLLGRSISWLLGGIAFGAATFRRCASTAARRPRLRAVASRAGTGSARWPSALRWRLRSRPGCSGTDLARSRSPTRAGSRPGQARLLRPCSPAPATSSPPTSTSRSARGFPAGSRSSSSTRRTA